MKLIDILVRELPKQGGWPDGADKLHQDYDGDLWEWHGQEVLLTCKLELIAENNRAIATDVTHEQFVTQEQYETALAATKEQKTTWKYIKGSEKDFVGCSDDIITKYRIIGSSSERYSSHSFKALTQCALGHKVEIIAQRELITAWDGSGLPPVGCECEAKYRECDNSKWFEFKCVGVDSGVAFGWARGDKGSAGDAVMLGKGTYEFRPIRSEEDKKRDDAIAEIVKMIGVTPESAAICYEVSLRIGGK